MAALIRDVSAVNRDTNSPLLNRRRPTRAPQVRDDPLAKRRDEIDP
jgi:hypothetical protein